VKLALKIREAEQELFNQGASDFLALQIREQSAFSAQTKSIEALEGFYLSLVDYYTSTASFPNQAN